MPLAKSLPEPRWAWERMFPMGPARGDVGERSENRLGSPQEKGMGRGLQAAPSTLAPKGLGRRGRGGTYQSGFGLGSRMH